MKNATNKKTARLLGLEIEVDFSCGDTTCPHVAGPETLLIDRSNRLFLADVEEDRKGRQVRVWVLVGGSSRSGGKRWKLSNEITAADLQEITLTDALSWYADHSEAYDSYFGDARRLARLAARALTQ